MRRFKPASTKKHEPLVVPRAKHSISRNNINPNALKVLYRLQKANYQAYLVGGCVRDLLMGFTPKDFDIATDARPEEVYKLFRNCRLIGKRFRLAHILFGKDIIEVATFRTHHENATHETHGKMHKGMIIRDNVFGEIEDDAWRRDFSINALYYNISNFSVVDYVNGMDDVNSRVLRMLGDPHQRYHEDPVRLLRAVRIMGKLDLGISPETEAPLIPLSHLLQHVAPARLFTEVLKFFQEGKTLPTFQLLQKYHLFSELFPETAAFINDPTAKSLIEKTLEVSDQRKREGKTLSPAFLFAVFLWHPIARYAKQNLDKDMAQYVAFETAIQHVFKKQLERLAIPKSLLIPIRDICLLQHRFEFRQGKRPFRLLANPRFRAAYDLLVLRSASGETITELSEWWTAFINTPDERRHEIARESEKRAIPRKRHPTRRFKKHGHKKPHAHVEHK